jgi:hypothetical protein
MFLRETLRRARFRSKIVRRPLVWWRYRDLKQADVLLATYPRSGTTWMRFILYEALFDRLADFALVGRAFPYVGRQEVAERFIGDEGRLIQTHETYCPLELRVIYMVRDPRDVVVSQYHFYRRDKVILSDFNRFFDEWLTGRATPFGAWDAHIKFWLDRTVSNHHLHVVRYEALRTDPVDTVEGVLRFLGFFIDRDVLLKAVANNTVERMREKEDRDPYRWGAKTEDQRFVRSGSVGGWKSLLSDEQEQRMLRKFDPLMKRLGYEIP